MHVMAEPKERTTPAPPLPVRTHTPHQEAHQRVQKRDPPLSRHEALTRECGASQSEEAPPDYIFTHGTAFARACHGHPEVKVRNGVLVSPMARNQYILTSKQKKYGSSQLGKFPHRYPKTNENQLPEFIRPHAHKNKKKKKGNIEETEAERGGLGNAQQVKEMN